MAFATTDDVATRLGRSLTAAEAAMAEQVIEDVTADIVDAVDRDLDWVETVGADTTTARRLRALCVGKVLAVGANPNDLASESETLGAYAHSKTYARNGSASFAPALTDHEKRMCRDAVYGSLTGSSTPRAVPDRLIDLRENRDVDELETP